MRHRPHPWDYVPWSFAIRYRGNTNYASWNYTAPLNNMAHSRYWNNTIDVVLNNDGALTSGSDRFRVDVKAMLCPPQGCPPPPVPDIGTPMMWSKPSSWQSKKVPVGGQRVTIDANMWIVMDVSPPSLGCLTVYGKLSFHVNATHPLDLSLAVQCLVVYGTFEIIGEGGGPYNGLANVLVYGGKGASLPVVVKEGAFLGSKVVVVVGNFTAIGKPNVRTWTRLNSTHTSGTREVSVTEAVDWKIGDEIVFSPTGYYDAAGELWYEGSTGSQVEIRRIVNVTTLNVTTYEEIVTYNISSAINGTDNGTISYVASKPYLLKKFVLNAPLNHTHLCEMVEGEMFCGAVGLLTKTVRFTSAGSENINSRSYGFGPHIVVVDVPKANPPRYPQLQLLDVELKNFGKVNSDQFAVTFLLENNLHPPSIIANCTFNSGYNMAVRIGNAQNLTVEGNVALGNYGGGIFVEKTARNYVVKNNLVIGTYNLPSILASSFPWTRPIAAFFVLSPHGVLTGNLAAGSADQGFSVVDIMFIVPRSTAGVLCTVTRSNAYPDYGSYELTNHLFVNNEAVACRGGLQLISIKSSVNDIDCAVVTGFKSWRNGHTGVLSLDTKANILLHDLVLAENHIGVSLHFFKGGINSFAGVINSKIIGSLALNNQTCEDLPDSAWLRGSHCQVFTPSDPLGLDKSCGSSISGRYKRVGILIPEWTNRGRTCEFAERFSGRCEPPNTPDRLCLLPWDNRYALPSNLYTELHIHDTQFLGFGSVELLNSQSSHCVPTASQGRSAAIAIAPEQIDRQPTIVMSGITWKYTNERAKYGFEIVSDCMGTCSGLTKIIFHDLDGTASDNPYGEAGQMLFNNPGYIESYPACYELAEQHPSLFFCPSTPLLDNDMIASDVDLATNLEVLRQYSATWKDSGPQLIGPIVTTRKLPSSNRTFANNMPIADQCAKRMPFSQYPLLFASGREQNVMSTGTLPNTFYIIWEAPSSDDSTVINFFVQHGNAINVFVSDDFHVNYRIVPRINRKPRLNDTAGTNARDPQARQLSVTLRGGRFRYYKVNQSFYCLFNH